MRIVEIIVAVNALCGIAAFVIARGLIRKTRRKIFGELNEPKESARSVEEVRPPPPSTSG